MNLWIIGSLITLGAVMRGDAHKGDYKLTFGDRIAILFAVVFWPITWGWMISDKLWPEDKKQDEKGRQG